MNKERRKRLIKVLDKIDKIALEIENIRDEEVVAYHNLSTGLQDSELGIKIMDTTIILDDLYYALGTEKYRCL